MREVYFKFIGPHFIEMEAKDMNEKERQDRIWEHCKKLSEEMLEWDKEDEERSKQADNELNAFYEGV